jgi:twitching motility protein PilT
MAEKPTVSLLGRIAVHNKLITMDQLAEATSEQGRRRDGSHLGDILLEMGFVNQKQHNLLVKAQSEMLAKARAKQATVNAAPGLEADPEPSSGEAATRPAPARREEQQRQQPQSQPKPAKINPDDAQQRETPPEAQKSSQRIAATTSVVPSEADLSRFEEVLSDLVSRGASDIHIHSGSPIKFRVDGRLQARDSELTDASNAERLVLSALADDQREQFAEHGELDFCHTIDGVGRFRANIYRQHRGVDGVFRFIPSVPPSLEELGLPTSLAKFINYHQGMVLCTGPTGCGKSSTLAALVNLINEERREHILTIEDPIEFLHVSKRCLVNQRSVNRHTESFARALRGALREDPDVIVIGELRDLETISLALSAAETGHLVIATLHTNNAIRTINRLIGAFPADQQGQVRTMMSESLRAVISQRLIPRVDGQGRVAVVEKLVITKAVGNLIRENKTFQIHSILQTGASQGMCLMDESIRQHLAAGAISREEAEANCENLSSLDG